jgi:hypothetical protein
MRTRQPPLKTSDMRLFRITPAVPVAALAVVLTGCADPMSDTSGSPSAPDSSVTAASTTPPARSDRPAETGHKERIRPAGIAAVVEQRLAAFDVRSYGSYGDEPGSVDLIIGLRDPDRRDMFVVSAYAPGQADGAFGAPSMCRGDKRTTKHIRQLRCHRLADGTTVMAYLSPGGFSDDNPDGTVVTGTSQSPDGSVALAMYESYDPSPAVTVADLERLLSDRRLRWRTDPAVNAAGRRLAVRRLTG